MTEVLVGSAYSTMELRYQQFTEGAAAVEQTIARLQALTKTPISLSVNGGATGGGVAPAQIAAPSGAASGAAVAVAADANAAALSREALAAGDAARAVELMNQALGKTTESETKNTTATQASVSAQAALEVVLNNRIGAIELLEAAHARQTEGSAAEVAIQRQLIQIENQGVSATQREADAAIRLAQEQARAAIATKDYAGALSILNGVETEGASVQTVAALETQIAATERAGTVTGAFAGQLSALVNPTTLVIAGIGVATKALQSFGEAADFVGKLQDARTAFGGILGDLNKGNAILDTAARRTRQFGLTEEETTQAFRQLAPVIRESTATTNQQAEALARFAVIHPEDPVDALKTAAEGLASGGRITQIAKDLDLTVGEQARLKQAASEGGDVFVLLNDILDKHGITLDVAAKRMDGLAGATRREQIAAADLKKAQGNFAAGPGIAITNEQVRLLNDTTNLLNGNFKRFATDNGPGFVKTITDVPTVLGPVVGSLYRYNSAMLGLGGSLLGLNAPTAQASAATSRLKDDFYDAAAAEQVIFAQSARVGGAFDDERRAAAALPPSISALTNARYADTAAITDQIAKQQAGTLGAQEAAKAQDLLAQLGGEVANGFQTAGGAALLYANKLNVAYGQALALINAQAQIAQQAGNAQAFIDQRAGERSGGTVRSQSELSAADAARKLAADHARQLQDAQDNAALQRATTAGQKIAILQRELARSTDDIQRVNIQAQIDAAKTGGKTRVSAAQTTALQLQNVEENSGLQLLKTQRENAEKLRDQESDFELGRTRKQEDYAEQRQKLLAHGQRAQAADLAKDFAKDQRRSQEDFNIARQRTLRNNAEGTGDIDTRTDLRQSQIGQRAALRGVRPAGGAPIDLGSAPPSLTGAPGRAGAGGITLVVQVQQLPIQLDGKTIATASWAELQKLIDDDLAETLRAVVVPSPIRAAVAGPPP